DGERRVGREGGGHHRRAREPPREVAARQEVFADVFTGAARVIEADQQRGDEVRGNDGPVDRGQSHLLTPCHRVAETRRKRDLWQFFSASASRRPEIVTRRRRETRAALRAS